MEIHYVTVDSDFRDANLYPSANGYTMHLNNTIHCVTRVELVQAIVPNSTFNIDNGTNIIQVDGSTYSVAPGYYTAPDLAGVIQSAIYPSTGIDVGYNRSQNAFAFYRSTSDPRGVFVITFSTELAKLMGFTSVGPHSGIVIADVPIPSVVPLFSLNESYQNYVFLRSDTLANLRGDSYIYFDVEELASSKNQQAHKLDNQTFGTSRSQSSFGPIPLNVNPGDIKVFSETSDFCYGNDYNPPIQQLSRLTINWRRPNGDLVDFKSLTEHSAVLRIHAKRKYLSPEFLEIPKEEDNVVMETKVSMHPSSMFGPLSGLGD